MLSKHKNSGITLTYFHKKKTAPLKIPDHVKANTLIAVLDIVFMNVFLYALQDCPVQIESSLKWNFLVASQK